MLVDVSYTGRETMSKNEGETLEERIEESDLVVETEDWVFGLYSDTTAMEYSHGPEKKPTHKTTVEFRTIRSNARPGGNGWGSTSFIFYLKRNKLKTEEKTVETFDIQEINFPTPRPTPKGIRAAGKLLERYAEATNCEYTNSVWEETV